VKPAQILALWHFDCAQTFKMRRHELRIEQDKLPLLEVMNKGHERGLRRILHSTKHRFSKKSSAERDAVQSAGNLAVVPRFNRIREASPVKFTITLDNCFGYPRFLAVCTPAHHRFK
jgi:hypothetical protein